MTWNYRMVRYPNGQGFGLHEVYYNEDGTPLGMTSDPCGFTADSPGELVTSLNQARDDAYMLEAFDPPEEWGDGSGQPRRQPIHRETDIIQWGIDRNIYDGSTPQRQALKGLEEACELFVAIMMGDRDGIIDGIGDTTVCNVHQARFLGMQAAECIEHSWNEIKDRGGEMRSGVFVKEADLADAEPDRGVEPDEPMGPRDAVFALEHAMAHVFSKLLLQANAVEPKGGES